MQNSLWNLLLEETLTERKYCDTEGEICELCCHQMMRNLDMKTILFLLKGDRGPMIS